MFKLGLDEKLYGPYIKWRDSKFLKNPKVRKSFLNDRLNIDTCREQNTTCRSINFGKVVSIKYDWSIEKLEKHLKVC